MSNMNEVKRWDVGTDFDCGVMNERRKGDYVEYDDYAALKAERDALAAENLALKQRTEELAMECTRINREAQSLSNQVTDCDRLRLAAQSQLREMKQRAEAAEAQRAELAASFDELAKAVGWSVQQCEQTGESPMDVAASMVNRLAAVSDATPAQYESLRKGD